MKVHFAEIVRLANLHLSSDDAKRILWGDIHTSRLAALHNIKCALLTHSGEKAHKYTRYNIPLVEPHIWRPICSLTVARSLTSVLSATNHSVELVIWGLTCGLTLARSHTKVHSAKNHLAKVHIWGLICWHTLEKRFTCALNATNLSVKLGIWRNICSLTLERRLSSLQCTQCNKVFGRAAY